MTKMGGPKMTPFWVPLGDFTLWKPCHPKIGVPKRGPKRVDFGVPGGSRGGSREGVPGRGGSPEGGGPWEGGSQGVQTGWFWRKGPF